MHEPLTVEEDCWASRERGCRILYKKSMRPCGMEHAETDGEFLIRLLDAERAHSAALAEALSQCSWQALNGEAVLRYAPDALRAVGVIVSRALAASPADTLADIRRAERERVREMCEKACEAVCIQPGFTGYSAGASACVLAIRALDLSEKGDKP